MQGWIKLHRKSLTSSVFQREKLWKVFCYCLLRANHSQTKLLWNGDEIRLQPGQFIFGRYEAAKDLKMKPSTLRNQMQLLRKLKILDIKSDSRYSLVTICNWQAYQGSENGKGQVEGHTRGQPEDIDKNDNNEIIEEEEVFRNQYFRFTKYQLDELKRTYPAVTKFLPEFTLVSDIIREKAQRGEVVNSPVAFLHSHLKNVQARELGKKQRARNECVQPLARSSGEPSEISEILKKIGFGVTEGGK